MTLLGMTNEWSLDEPNGNPELWPREDVKKVKDIC